MRHRKAGFTLDRTRAPRVAMLRQLATSLIVHERITTTFAKARAVRPLVETAITRSRKPTLAARRQLLKNFSPKTVDRLLTQLGPRFAERPGGYTRMTKRGPRKGDGASVVTLEFVS
jgi:large subunit ribosomal protein L17